MQTAREINKKPLSLLAHGPNQHQTADEGSTKKEVHFDRTLKYIKLKTNHLINNNKLIRFEFAILFAAVLYVYMCAVQRLTGHFMTSTNKFHSYKGQ